MGKFKFPDKLIEHMSSEERDQTIDAIILHVVGHDDECLLEVWQQVAIEDLIAQWKVNSEFKKYRLKKPKKDDQS